MHLIRFTSADGLEYHGEDCRNGQARLLHMQLHPGSDDQIVILRVEETRPIHKLLAPIEPPNILCAGRNYPGSGVSAGDELELFMKPTTAIAHPDEPIRLPRCGVDRDPQLACEGELAIVIGRLARDASEQDAIGYILGYTLANDLTARRWQTKEGPPRWMRGKGFDTFCPLGPAIVTPDELPTADASGLTITTRINGRVYRTGSTNEMIRSVPRLIAEISNSITLRPGTVILTGAPAMLEGAEDPPLADGDRMEVHCEQIGTLSNVVHAPLSFPPHA